MPRVRTRPTKEQTANRLVEGARKAIAERSFYGASVDHICEAAGLTRGAFYSGFESKEELFLAVYDQVSLDVAELLGKALERAVTSAGDPIAKLFEEFAAGFPLGREWYILNAEMRLVALRSETAAAALIVRRQTLRDRIVAPLRVALQKSARELAVDADLLARALIGLTDAGMGESLLEPDKLTTKTFIETFFASFVTSCTIPVDRAPSN